MLAQPRLNYGSLEPGGEATRRSGPRPRGLPFVASGRAHVAITGQVALSDEEFSSVAEGVAVGLAASIVLITLWLFLAVKTWRLIVPILLTLVLGLSLTLLFAAAAVGTLNLISVGFGILFVGIAVDFAIQFSVRFRERRHEFADFGEAIRQTAARTGEQILVAAVATAAGFLAFVPTDFVGVAELGLIAGVGMLIAFVCTITFLPAAITLFRPPGEPGMVGFHWAIPLDPLVAAWRRPILLVFGVVAIAGVALCARADVRFQPPGHQEPAYRSDAHPARAHGFAADQSVHGRHTGTERRMPLHWPRCARCPRSIACAASTASSRRTRTRSWRSSRTHRAFWEPTLTAPASRHAGHARPCCAWRPGRGYWTRSRRPCAKLEAGQSVAGDRGRFEAAHLIRAGCRGDGHQRSLTFLPQELDQLRDSLTECRDR